CLAWWGLGSRYLAAFVVGRMRRGWMKSSLSFQEQPFGGSRCVAAKEPVMRFKFQRQTWLTVMAGYACLTMVRQMMAHPADITPLRVQVQEQKLEFRFTFSLFTLG